MNSDDWEFDLRMLPVEKGPSQVGAMRKTWAISSRRRIEK